MDCYHPEGGVMIGYLATLRWKGLSLPYTSLLLLPVTGRPVRHSRFRKPAGLQQAGDSIGWDDPGFGIKATWVPTAPPISATLFGNEAGRIYWKCEVPRADASFVMKEGAGFRGQGYVEELIMEVPPWKIAMDALYWGRYHAVDTHVVWIKFGEPEGRTWVFVNGVQMDEGEVSDDVI
ncbi:MAG: hypothetical protein OEX02_19500, partial [Cyclobacteriaceae bacterium]|nr:hypothetical protein [Cyclobacteriaceae bacterium]